MDFVKKLKIRRYTAIACIATGILLTVLFAAKIIARQYALTLGIALITIGFARALDCIRITKNSESIRKRQIAESDERNIYIINKAKSTAFGVYVITTAIIIIAAEMCGKSDLAETLALTICALVLLYWTFYWLYRKVI